MLADSEGPDQIARMGRLIWGFAACLQLKTYSWLSLARPRLSRITAYLEVKIWSLSKHENLTTGKKYCGKEEKLLLWSNFSSFPQYFQYSSNFKSPVTYIFVKCGCLNYFFLNFATLICRGTDISKYFIESLGIGDNESLLYLRMVWPTYLVASCGSCMSSFHPAHIRNEAECNVSNVYWHFVTVLCLSVSCNPKSSFHSNSRKWLN